MHSAILIRFYLVWIFSFARYVDVRRASQIYRLVRSDLVVFGTPFLQVLIRIGKVKKSISFKKFVLHRTMKPFYLSLRLRVQWTTVDRKYVQIHQPSFKECITTLKTRKCTAIVG